MTRRAKVRVFDTVASLTVATLLPLVGLDLMTGRGDFLTVYECLTGPVHRWALR